MAKDPAFLFYPGDWNLGTMHMTLLEKGAYIELLMLQFARGKFTLAHAKHMLNGSFDLAWANISEKFETDGTFYWNERLEQEKEKRKNFTESRRSNASIKKIIHNNNKAHAKHMPKHMEDENENENDVLILDVKQEIEPKAKNFSPPEKHEVITYLIDEKNWDEFSAMAFADKFWNYYESNNWKVGKNKMSKWKAAVNTWINKQKEYDAKPNHPSASGTNGARKSKQPTAADFAEFINS